MSKPIVDLATTPFDIVQQNITKLQTVSFESQCNDFKRGSNVTSFSLRERPTISSDGTMWMIKQLN